MVKMDVYAQEIHTEMIRVHRKIQSERSTLSGERLPHLGKREDKNAVT